MRMGLLEPSGMFRRFPVHYEIIGSCVSNTTVLCYCIRAGYYEVNGCWPSTKELRCRCVCMYVCMYVCM